MSSFVRVFFGIHDNQVQIRFVGHNLWVVHRLADLFGNLKGCIQVYILVDLMTYF